MKQGFRREYGAVVFDRVGVIVARVRVIAWANYMTQDQQFQLSDERQNIGTITAYCERVNVCPDEVNQV